MASEESLIKTSSAEKPKDEVWNTSGHPTRKGPHMDEQPFEPVVTIDVVKERDRPRLVALLFCDYANQTKEGKNNLLGTFDSLYLDPEKGKSTPRFIMFLRAYRVQSGQLQVSIFAPSGELGAALRVGVTTSKDEPPESRSHLQALLQVQFEVSDEGKYWVDVSHDGVSLGGAMLTILFRKREAE